MAWGLYSFTYPLPTGLPSPRSMATSAERRAAHDGSHPAAYSHPATPGAAAAHPDLGGGIVTSDEIDTPGTGL